MPTRPLVPARRAAPAAVVALAVGSLAAAAAAQDPVARLVPPSPAPGGFVADGGPVLDDAARARLNARIAGVRGRTGGDVGVAIVRDLGGRAPAEVGVAIYRAWGVGTVDSLGSARRHLGALLLVVPKELAPTGRGECWITTGLGAEGTLRDADAGAICRDSIIPHLRERRYEAAVAAGVDAVAGAFARATGADGAAADSPAAGDARALAGAPGAAADALPTVVPYEPPSDAPLAIIAAIGLLAFAVHRAPTALEALRRRRPHPCPQGHGAMRRLGGAELEAALTHGQRAEQRLGSREYDVWACRHCDARLVEAHDGRTRYERCPGCRSRTLVRTRRTLVEPTADAEGREEVRRACAACGWRDRGEFPLARRERPVASSAGLVSWDASDSSGVGSDRDSSGGSSDFGGDGGTSGGGGGSSY